MMINGKEVKFPFDIDNILSQIMGEPPIQQQEKIIPPQHQVIKKVLICQDVNARKAILGMDKRITRLEEQLKELSQSKNKPKKKIDIKKKEVKQKISPDKTPIKTPVKNPDKHPSKNPIKKVIKKKSVRKPVSIPKKKSGSNIKKKSKR